MKRKAFSLFMVLAMIVGLFSGLTMTASADVNGVWDGTVATAYNSGTGTDSDPYIITTGSELAFLAKQVNDGEDTSSTYYELGNNIYLNDENSSNLWTPIGGRWSGNSGTPASTSKSFAGVFNGKGYTISGLNVTDTTSGVGLFGYVNGGIIGNLTVTGSVTVTDSHAAIGGLVGYTNGSLVNCTSNVKVTATGSSNVGGLAGIVENTASDSTITVTHCKSTKDVSASKRMGGLIGGAYAAVTGGVQVDGCSVLDGDNSTGDTDVESSSLAYKSFIGGLIGYCEACVSNCLVGENVKVSANGSDGHRMGGIVGILSGYGSAKGKLAECVFLGTITNYNSNTSYDGAICVPESGTTMTNCYYIETAGPGQKTNSTSWFATALTENQMKGSATIDGTHYIGYFLNQAPSWNSAYNNEWTCGTVNSPAYPYVKPMTERTMAQLVDYGTGTSYTGNDTAYAGSVVYYDSTAASGGDGTADTPYNSFSEAVDHLGSNAYLCVKSAVSVSDYTAKASSLTGKTIARSYTYTAPIFTVGSNQTLNLTGITIDGNDAARGNETMILIQGGTVTVDANSTLKNNHTISRDSAVRVEDSGSLTINGSVKGNVSALGGVIYVEHGSTFNLGTVNGIDSTDTGKIQMVYLDNSPGYSDASITMTSAVTNTLTIKCSNPFVGMLVAEAPDDVADQVEYDGNTYNFLATGSAEQGYNITLY